jgi:hypothetical protein
MTLGVTMLLADHAQVANGKLFISGGGWSVVDAPTPPFHIALLLLVPWDRAGVPLDLMLTLIDEDGRVVRQGGSGSEVRVQGQIAVERPPAHLVGVPLDVPMVIGIPSLDIAGATRYTWMLDVDGQTSEDWRLSFSTR